METKPCANCGKTMARKPGWSRPSWEASRFCSLACSSVGRWKGPSADSYRIRLGAARRAWNEAHPEENRARLAKTAATKRINFPSLRSERVGRAVAAGLVPLDNCSDCGRPYNGPRSLHRHHIDGDPTHNDRGNIVVVCVACHRNRHDAMGHGFGGVRRKPKDCPVCGNSFVPSKKGGLYCSRACFWRHRRAMTTIPAHDPTATQ